MTAEISDGKKIQPESLFNYQVKPPLDILPVAETQPMPNNTIGNDNVLGTQKTDLIKELAMEVPENEGEEYDGHCDDCTETPTYCGKKIGVLYENGWFEGDIEYYDKNICKYHISFHDVSEDYIGEDHIDMIEVVF